MEGFINSFVNYITKLFFLSVKKIAPFPLNSQTAVLSTQYIQEEKGIIICDFI